MQRYSLQTDIGDRLTKVNMPRRFGAEDSAVREKLVDAARELMHLEGCSAITAGRMADLVGLKRPIVHYYFRTIEELILAVMRRDAAAIRCQLIDAMAQGNPLRAIWQRSRSTSGRTLELVAMATRNDKIRAEVAGFMADYRHIALAALEDYIRQNRIEPSMSPEAALGIVNSAAYALSMESELRVSSDSAALRNEIERLIEQFDAVIAKDT